VAGALALPPAAHAQTQPEAQGVIHGFMGMMNVIDDNTSAPSAGARPGFGLYWANFRPNALGPEIAFTTVFDAVSVNVAFSINAGVSYQIGERLSVGAGGSLLSGIKRWMPKSLDPHYGGYLGLTWMARPLGRWLALTTQVRQQVLYDPAEGRVVFYPSIGIGLLFVPEAVLTDLG